MVRIALFVLLLIIVGVAVAFPKFRRTLGVILVILMGAIGLIIWQDSQEHELEFTRISSDEVQLQQMQARPGLNTRSFVVDGRLHNLAQDYTILSVQLQATAKDCYLGNCEVVGQEDRIFPLEVPPDQARDFSVTIPFSVTPKVQGEIAWEYKILKIRAR